MFREAISLEPNSPNAKAVLGSTYLYLGDIKQAEYWCGQAIEMSPQGFISNINMFFLNAYLGEEESAKKYGHTTLTIYDDLAEVLAYFQDLDLKAGRYDEARKWLGEAYPELLNTESLNIDITNYEAAISYAYALIKTGDHAHADMLLNASLNYINTLPRLGQYGYGIADVCIYTLQEKIEEALDSLRKAVASGWCYWLDLEQESILKPLHKEPEFEIILHKIKDDMAVQLAQVRELEKNYHD